MQDTDIPVRVGQNGGTMRHFSQHHSISLPPPPPLYFVHLVLYSKTQERILQYCHSNNRQPEKEGTQLSYPNPHCARPPQCGSGSRRGKKTEIKPAPEVRTVLGEQKYLGILKKLLKNCVVVLCKSI